jgi:exonuclease 3'-5' domain-containing protein 1
MHNQPLAAQIRSTIYTSMEAEIIDTAAALSSFLTNLPQHIAQPNLFIDLEGNKLSRHGTLSLLTILVEPRHTVHLIDVHVLGNQAFTVASTDSSSSTTLKKMLESVSIAKVFFDIRHDSDALFGLYGIRVSGIEDLQLMELASRNAFESKRYVSGLAKCIQNYSQLSWAEKQQFKAVKEQGLSLFDPARGGSYAVFDQRPLSAEVAKYCAQDALHMPGLYDVFKAKLSAHWKEEVKKETAARIELSQSAQGVGRGPQNAQGPMGW